MGIKALLPFLKPIHEKCHLSDFTGQSIGIDSYCWIHRAIVGCATKLVRGEKTDFYIKYFIRRIELLLQHKITPILVFDGAIFEPKSGTEKIRKENRDKNKKLGDEFLAKGDKKEAYVCYKKCLEVTPEMAAEIIQECKKREIACIVAPYEADAQLAFLSKIGLVQACISEDSDLLVFGCNKVIYKLDDNGNGILINRDHFVSVTELKHAMHNVSFLELCVLSGCDYLPSIKGIGISTACKLAKNHSSLSLIIKRLRVQKGSLVPKTYEDDFEKAVFYFENHWIFDVLEVKISPLSGKSRENLSIHGCSYVPSFSDSVAFQIALGNLHPTTFKKLSNNQYSDFKILYESADSKNLMQASEEHNIKNENITPIPMKCPSKTSIFSIPSSHSAMCEFKSLYFIKSPSDESLLSPIIFHKDPFRSVDDEDIQSFAKKSVLDTVSPTKESPKMNSTPKNGCHCIGLSRVRPSKSRNSKGSINKSNSILQYFNKM